MLIFLYNLTLKARYDPHCVESAVKLQPTNQPESNPDTSPIPVLTGLSVG